MPKIVGIDPSLTNTALYCDGDYLEIPGKKLRGILRLQHIYEETRSFLRKHKPRVVVIEGYAFAARARQHRLGEVGGVIRLACIKEGVDRLYEVPPTSLKKFFTGAGNAEKGAMIEEAERRHNAKLPSDDVADACALWYAGHDNGFLNAKAEQEKLRG